MSDRVIEIRVPAGPAKLVLVRWYTPPGEFIRAGSPLCELETNGVTVDLLASRDGVIEQAAAARTCLSAGHLIGQLRFPRR